MAMSALNVTYRSESLFLPEGALLVLLWTRQAGEVAKQCVFGVAVTVIVIYDVGREAFSAQCFGRTWARRSSVGQSIQSLIF